MVQRVNGKVYISRQQKWVVGDFKKTLTKKCSAKPRFDKAEFWGHPAEINNFRDTNLGSSTIRSLELPHTIYAVASVKLIAICRVSAV